MRRLIIFLLLICISGCGGAAAPYSESANYDSVSYDGVASMDKVAAEASTGDVKTTDADSPETGKRSTASRRKIIYSSKLRFVVKDVDQTSSLIRQKVESAGGFIASSELNTNRGSYRVGNWVARVPTDHYTEFLAAIESAGKCGESFGRCSGCDGRVRRSHGQNCQ